MQYNKLMVLNKYLLIFSLLIMFTSETMGYISIYNSFGASKLVSVMNYWLYIMPFIFIYFIIRKYKYAYIALFLLSIYLLIKIVGISSITTLFTMFFWKYFSLQPYLYYLSSWLIPLFALIGLVLQIREYREKQK